MDKILSVDSVSSQYLQRLYEAASYVQTGDGQKSTTEAETWALKKAQKQKAIPISFSLPAPVKPEEELQLRLITSSAGVQCDEACQPAPKSWDLDTQPTSGNGEKFEFSS